MPYKFIYTVIMILFSLIFFPAHGETQEASNETIAEYKSRQGEIEELTQYLVEAARNNDDLYSAFYSWKAALQRETSFSSLPDPRFSFAWFIQPVETRTGPQEFKYGLSQTLPWFGKLDLKGEQALRDADIKKAKFDALKLKIFYQVKKTYYDYAFLAQAIRITRENIELMKYLESVARSRYTTGSGTYDGVIKAQVELGKLEDRLRSLEERKRPTSAKLLAAMNRSSEGVLPLPASIPVMKIEIDPLQLKKDFKESNPRLLALTHKINKEKVSVELAEKDYFPDFSFGVEYIQTGKSRSPNVTNADRDPIVAGMSVNLPIWLDKQEAQLVEAKYKVKSASRERAGLERNLSADLELEIYRYEDAIRKVKLYQDSLTPKAEQSLAVSIESFQSGTASSSDLIDAERTLIEFQLVYYEALAEQAKKVAAIEYLVGREIPCTVHGSTLTQTSAIISAQQLKQNGSHNE
ncbi:TolC family protein [Maridesulfovibrio hydrothermalis]|uniref:Outer membrane efflux protein n=1 Tax=Maridesulfovibrio hydrothermalis AM13 = DSM 14728 TaxID=1121451 RepID=L0RDL1_9BACT|nr:TolC family protein [Maridesulfovibrio hydrothermalis]CCO23651.1 Outer membrane efflux protein [Maridesulfovibrio hydrothermalis AM13 = DSM 14728]